MRVFVISVGKLALGHVISIQIKLLIISGAKRFDASFSRKIFIKFVVREASRSAATHNLHSQGCRLQSVSRKVRRRLLESQIVRDVVCEAGRRVMANQTQTNSRGNRVDATFSFIIYEQTVLDFDFQALQRI